MEYPLSHWRLLVTPPATGEWNMAVDEAILESIQNELEKPTLRLYAWQPACLSLGYAQPASDVDMQRLNECGWQLVRRPTGGRAILHTDELTYSVIGPPGEPRLSGSLLESYRCLAQALLQALWDMGIPAEARAAPPARGSDPKGPVCFESPSNYEITVQGKKLIGSAQARRKNGVLQHGSFPLQGNLTRITQALAFPDESARQAASQRLRQRATTAEEILGQALPWEAAARAFTGAFAQTLNLDLVSGDLSEQEKTRTHELVREKYASPCWTARIP